MNKDFLNFIFDWLFGDGLQILRVKNICRDITAVCYANSKFWNSSTVRKEQTELHNSHEVKIKVKRNEISWTVSITSEAWSLYIFKGYLSLTLHWVDRNWCLQNVMFVFARLLILHNDQKTSTLRFELLFYCKLIGKVNIVTTDNASGIVAAMGRLTDVINIRNNIKRSVDDIHVRRLEKLRI